MITGLGKPSVFIGSSVEKLDIAYTMQEHLEYTTEPTVWDQDIFKPSSYTLVDLEKAARNFQFAVFIFAPDDVVTKRGVRSEAVRDNIIFEFGLFVGALGLARCFFLVPRGSEPLHLPTDLLGLTPLTYEPSRSDKNIVAALGPAANRVRRAVREQLKAEEVRVTEAAVESEERKGVSRGVMTTEDYVRIWDSARIQELRKAVHALPSNPYGYDDEELGFYNALRGLFAFLESLADAVISGDIDEATAHRTFEQPVRLLWPHMHTALAPPNHADDWWRPLPRIAELYARWQSSEHRNGR